MMREADQNDKPSDLCQTEEERFVRLNFLLEQTSVFSTFLAQKLRSIDAPRTAPSKDSKRRRNGQKRKRSESNKVRLCLF